MPEDDWAEWWRAWRHASWMNHHDDESMKMACNDTVFRPGLAGFLLHEYTVDEDNEMPPPGKHWFVFMWGKNPSTGAGRTGARSTTTGNTLKTSSSSF